MLIALIIPLLVNYLLDPMLKK